MTSDPRPGGDAPGGQRATGDEPDADAAEARPARARERKSMLLRLDPAVHEALARWAADDLRSTNAHVEWLLRRAVEDAGRLRPDR